MFILFFSFLFSCLLFCALLPSFSQSLFLHPLLSFFCPHVSFSFPCGRSGSSSLIVSYSPCSLCFFLPLPCSFYLKLPFRFFSSHSCILFFLHVLLTFFYSLLLSLHSFPTPLLSLYSSLILLLSHVSLVPFSSLLFRPWFWHASVFLQFNLYGFLHSCHF